MEYKHHTFESVGLPEEDSEINPGNLAESKPGIQNVSSDKPVLETPKPEILELLCFKPVQEIQSTKPDPKMHHLTPVQDLSFSHLDNHIKPRIQPELLDNPYTNPDPELQVHCQEPDPDILYYSNLHEEDNYIERLVEFIFISSFITNQRLS